MQDKCPVSPVLWVDTEGKKLMDLSYAYCADF